MANPEFGCGRPECSSSSNISDQISFGTGELDVNGFWEHPCFECAEEWLRRHPSLYPEDVWPFVGDKKNGEDGQV